MTMFTTDVDEALRGIATDQARLDLALASSLPFCYVMSILPDGRKGTFSQALYTRLSFCDVTSAASDVLQQPL